MRLRFRISAAVIIAAAFCAAWVLHRDRTRADESFAHEVIVAREQAAKVARDVVLFSSERVTSGAHFESSLQSLGIDPLTATAITGSISPVFDTRHFHAGNLLSVGRSVTGVLREVRYQIDADRLLSVEPRDSGFHAEIQTIPSHMETRTIVWHCK